MKHLKTRLRAWQRKLPINHQSWLGSWVRLDRHGPGDSVTCLFCPEYSPKVASLQLESLKKHARSKTHRARTNLCFGGAPDCLASSPSKGQFQKILQLRRDAVSHRKGSNVCSVRKSTKMTWCLGEAALDKDRHAISNSQCIAMSQDVQGETLSLRYSCSGIVNHTFFRKDGLIGFGKVCGGAAGLRSGTVKIIKRFCTLRRGVQRFGCNVKSKPHLDQSLYKIIKERTEIFTADKAPDEQKAIRSMSGLDSTTPKAMLLLLAPQSHAICFYCCLWLVFLIVVKLVDPADSYYIVVVV